MCLEGSVGLCCVQLDDCKSQFCCDHKAGLPPVCALSRSSFPAAQLCTGAWLLHVYNLIYLWQRQRVHKQLGAVGLQDKSCTEMLGAEGAEDGHEQSCSICSLKNQKCKRSLTCTWFWSQNICIFWHQILQLFSISFRYSELSRSRIH